MCVDPGHPDNSALMAMLHRAEAWLESNPFKERQLARLSALGGAHHPSTVADDRRVMAEEPCVELLRDLPAALTEPVQEW
ncbi:MAG: hypothetical protein AAF916_11135 [Planctomycetota bacterium]